MTRPKPRTKPIRGAKRRCDRCGLDVAHHRIERGKAIYCTWHCAKQADGAGAMLFTCPCGATTETPLADGWRVDVETARATCGACGAEPSDEERLQAARARWQESLQERVRSVERMLATNEGSSCGRGCEVR